jgi:two-component system response regulator
LTLHALRRNNIANHIHVVSDGEEALDFIFCENSYICRDINDVPKMILLDLKLPKIDGIEVLRRIKEDVRTRRIPVVMLTTSSEEKDIVKSYELGANSYIIKPVDFDQFTEAVRQLGLYWLLLNQQPELK